VLHLRECAESFWEFSDRVLETHFRNSFFKKKKIKFFRLEQNRSAKNSKNKLMAVFQKPETTNK
jgi:hypothetical protein